MEASFPPFPQLREAINGDKDSPMATASDSSLPITVSCQIDEPEMEVGFTFLTP